MGRILLVEDSLDCQLIVRSALHGMADVEVAPDLASASRLLAQSRYELLLLDVLLPDGNGFGLCSKLVEEKGAERPRVMFLTGVMDINEKLTGFSVGADDYITKPFHPLELRARVKAHLRNLEERTDSGQTLRTGNLTLHLASYRAEIDGPAGIIPLELTPTEFRLLYSLARHAGRIRTREQLLSAASESKLDVMDRTIDAHLCRIRKKLASCTHEIEAVYGVGYRLVRVRPE